MGKNKKGEAPLKVELSGGIPNSVSRIASGVADLVEVLFFSLTEIALAVTDMIVRYLQRH